jgi:hypothetical protein
METSCHTWSLFLRNYYKRWAFDRPTWVLFPVVEDLLRCSGFDRVRYNDVVKGR